MIYILKYTKQCIYLYAEQLNKPAIFLSFKYWIELIIYSNGCHQNDDLVEELVLTNIIVVLLLDKHSQVEGRTTTPA